MALQVDLARRILALQEDVVVRDIEIERLREALDRCEATPDREWLRDPIGHAAAVATERERCAAYIQAQALECPMDSVAWAAVAARWWCASAGVAGGLTSKLTGHQQREKPHEQRKHTEYHRPQARCWGPVQRVVRPRAWERADGMKAITDDELEAWIQSGEGQIVDDYTVPLYDQAAIDSAVAAERERCAALCDSYEPLGREGPQTTAYELARAIRGRDA